ncbi:hypothetical protein ACJW30_01G007000 [Castanea mollissima]
MATQLTLFFSSKPNKYPPIFPIPNPKLYHHHHYHYNYKTQIPKIPFSSSSFRNGSNTPQPETDCPVPLEQQPINEYQNLSTSFPFSWASGDIAQYSSRLFITGTSFALFIGLPVAWLGTVGPDSEPFKRVLCAFSNEETGWYDGQVWVKTAEVLARDRLLGSFSVKPVLSRLKFTLVSLAASLFVCVLLLINIDGGQKVEASGRVIPGVYNDESARSFEPDAFCGEPGLP